MAMKFPVVTPLSSCSMRYCTSPRQEYFVMFRKTNSTEASFCISCTVADLNAINIVAAKAIEKPDVEEEDEEEEEEEFVKYGAVDEFYDLDKEIGK